MNGFAQNSALDARSFQAIADLARKECGLQLVAEKSTMIQSRLRSRLKAIGADSFDAYASYVCSDAGKGERVEMISALTTNVSHFFREQHHFEILKSEVLPRAIEVLKSGGRFRIWSAGCSNGQEPYSVAITALSAFPDIVNSDFKILATDIDPKVVRFATEGRYPERLTSGIPSDLLAKYFTHSVELGETVFRASETLKSCIVFKELNLLSEWPISGQIDLIFCRNVVIYFDVETQNRLWPRFNRLLPPDGRLLLGHSERIADPSLAGFTSVGPTAYRKLASQNGLAGKGTSYVT